MRAMGLALVAVTLGSSVAACSSQTSPTHVGLYYNVGSSEGNEFSHCTAPGKTDTYPVNDEIFYVPIDGRTWLNDDIEGADDKELILVTAAPEPGQTTGVAVKISSQTSFMLNSYCGVTNEKGVAKDKNSPLVKWWDKYGRGYGANVDPELSAEDQRKDAGWVNMLRNTLVPALRSAIRDSAKNYPASALVNGTANSPMVVDKVQRKGLRTDISEALMLNLERLTGNKFFCGPTFDRASSECPAIEVTTQAELASTDLLAAQGEKQAAVERAAAALIEAQGKVDAAEKLKDLLSKEQWLDYQKTVVVELEKAKLLAETQKDMATKCASSPNCTLIIGADGKILGMK